MLRLHQLNFALLLYAVFLFLNITNALPTGIVKKVSVVVRQAGQSPINSPTTVETVHTADTVAGAMTETCVVALTPITDSTGKPAVQEVRTCSIAMGNTGDAPPSQSSSLSGSPQASSAAAGSSSSASSTATDSSISTASVAATTSTGSSVTVSAIATGSSTIASDSPAASTVSSSISSVATSPSASATGSSSLPALSSIATTVSATPSGSTSSGSPSSASPTASATGPANVSVNPVSSIAATAIPSVTASVSPSDTAAPQITTSTSTSTSTSASAAPDAVASSASAAAEKTSSTQAAFQIPGKTLSVLPIGLGVFAGISVIALIVVGLVTYERTKYRKAFRQRKLAESGATLGYGGMAQRS